MTGRLRFYGKQSCTSVRQKSLYNILVSHYHALIMSKYVARFGSGSSRTQYPSLLLTDSRMTHINNPKNIIRAVRQRIGQYSNGILQLAPYKHSISLWTYFTVSQFSTQHALVRHSSDLFLGNLPVAGVFLTVFWPGSGLGSACSASQGNTSASSLR